MTKKSNLEEEIHFLVQFTTYIGYGVLMVVGYFRDWCDMALGLVKKAPKGYAPITRDFEEFYRRRLYGRIEDCWNRPITGPAGSSIEILERDNNLKLTGNKYKAINLSSYNYLGFAETGTPIEKEVLKTIDEYGVSTASSPLYAGKTSLHDKLEKVVAKFLQVEDAMIFGMGWGTNSTAIPTLVGKGCLIISDSINHNSIVIGARSSGASIVPFPHNNIKKLEKIVRTAIIDGQPKTHRPWKKILIIVEGVYSMEGEVCDLQAIVEIKKKYNCYLYLDEAHSIGAIGKTGRGVCEHRGVNPKDVDCLMGTFTKSFGAIGGYVAGTKKLISSLRSVCASHIYSSGLSPACVAQILGAFSVIQSEQGKKRIENLRNNSNYMRSKLFKLGLHVMGDADSAVIPVFVGSLAKLPCFSRMLLQKGAAIVIVGFPATPLLLARIRFCMSAAHTKQQIDDVCEIISEYADICHIKYTNRILG